MSAINITASSDLYSNKDALLSVSTFLSLKQLGLLRETSKQLNSWLSDYSSFSWKNRIELSFPTTFQEVLKEDTSAQIERLQKFDSLVDSGHQVSFFSLASLLKSTPVEVTVKYQVPWSRNLFIIVYNKTSAVLFSAATCRDICRVDFLEMKSVDLVLFDIKNNKIGFVNKVTGAMKLFSLTNNSLKFESDFTCDKLKPSREYKLIPQIYGDYIIISKDYSTKLVWYSLSSGNQVKELRVPGDDGIRIAPSKDFPLLYISATREETYVINRIDCTLEDEEVIAEEYSGYLDIEMENCGDGVTGLLLSDTEHGSVLNVYLMGTGDRAYQAVDVNSNGTLVSLHFGEWPGYKTIRYNPGSDFYSLVDDGVVTIMHCKKKYDDEKADEKNNEPNENNTSKYVDAAAEDIEEEYDVSEEGDETSDPTDGAYFKFKHQIKWTKWLNKDLFTAKSIAGSQSRQLFFSIQKRGIIGSIDDDISDVFISKNTLVAFTSHGDIYRITMKINCDESAENNHAKKRKIHSEMESDEDVAEELEVVPKKKQKV